MSEFRIPTVIENWLNVPLTCPILLQLHLKMRNRSNWTLDPAGTWSSARVLQTKAGPSSSQLPTGWSPLLPPICPRLKNWGLFWKIIKNFCTVTTNFQLIFPKSPFITWGTISHSRKYPEVTHVLHSLNVYKIMSPGTILPESSPGIHYFCSLTF